MKNHYVVRVRGQPGLHGLTNGTNPVERRGMKIGPAVVLHLDHRGGAVITMWLIFNSQLLLTEFMLYLWVKSINVVSLL